VKPSRPAGMNPIADAARTQQHGWSLTEHYFRFEESPRTGRFSVSRGVNVLVQESVS